MIKANLTSSGGMTIYGRRDENGLRDRLRLMLVGRDKLRLFIAGNTGELRLTLRAQPLGQLLVMMAQSPWRIRQFSYAEGNFGGRVSAETLYSIGACDWIKLHIEGRRGGMVTGVFPAAELRRLADVLAIEEER